jgi:hypothetical protein
MRGDKPGDPVYSAKSRGEPVTPEQLRIIRQRSAAYRQNPAAAIPLGEALARIERSLDDQEQEKPA